MSSHFSNTPTGINQHKKSLFLPLYCEIWVHKQNINIRHRTAFANDTHNALWEQFNQQLVNYRQQAVLEGHHYPLSRHYRFQEDDLSLLRTICPQIILTQQNYVENLSFNFLSRWLKWPQNHKSLTLDKIHGLKFLYLFHYAS